MQKKISFISILCILPIFCFAQCITSQMVWDSLAAIEKNILKNDEKVQVLFNLKTISERCKLPLDSVYAKILHQIGICELNNKNYNAAIGFTLKAKGINLSKKGGSKVSALSDYYALGYYCYQLSKYDKAISYFDSTIILAQSLFQSPENYNFLISSRQANVELYSELGDFEKVIEESTIGIKNSLNNNDTANYMLFLNQRAWAYYYQNHLEESLADAENVIGMAKYFSNILQLSGAYKIKGFNYAKKRRFSLAHSFLLLTIKLRLKTNNNKLISADYNDFGVLFLNSLNNYSEAKKYFLKAIEYAEKDNDSIRLSQISVNIGEVEFEQHEHEEASKDFLQALLYLKINCNNIWTPLNAEKLSAIENKDLILAITRDRVKVMLAIFKKTKNKKFLRACLESALTTDLVITQMRHTQLAEQSKLYWRNRTRSFFSNAIEACFLMKDIEHAFYFMEKSRSVLLNDKLNELGASGQLPLKEFSEEAKLKEKVLYEQEILSTFKKNTPAYNTQQLKFYATQEHFERYIKLLENKYPAYYEYKYQDSVTSLKDFQKYLARNKQSFIDYFINDTVCYVLGITADKAKLIKTSSSEINSKQIAAFLQLCSDKGKLFNDYSLFISLSNKIYTFLFQPLNITNSRVIICPDNFIIPFEALCTDSAGKKFLVNQYAFSYVYSARYLVKKYNSENATGDFIGFAPVTFSAYGSLPELKNSAVSLEQSAAYYTNKTIFLNSNATRHNFLSSISNYTVVNIFSHASADIAGSEPILFMHDSAIKLSELQLLQKPATKLVVLSACETGAGETAQGEGIYSLARGFSAAGISSVAATLWDADEEAAYAITEKFHQYLASGLPKDEALQKAKIYFIQKNSMNNQLPYYWANMILIGNSEALPFLPASKKQQPGYLWVWIFSIIIAVTGISFLIRKRR